MHLTNNRFIPWRSQWILMCLKVTNFNFTISVTKRTFLYKILPSFSLSKRITCNNKIYRTSLRLFFKLLNKNSPYTFEHLLYYRIHFCLLQISCVVPVSVICKEILVVVVCTSRSKNSTQRSQFFTQFAVDSTIYASWGDIYTQWEIVKKCDLVQK